MQNLIETAEGKARCAIDRAEAHMSFADMFHVAGMSKLAQSRKADSLSESRVAQFYASAADTLSNNTLPPTLRDIVESIQTRRGVTLAK